LNNMLALAQRVALDSNYSYSNEVYFSLLRYEPNKIDYLFSIAANMVELKKLDTAILILQDIIKKDSNYYKAYSKLGEIYGRYLNNLNLSEQYLLKAYSLNTNDASVLENLGIVYGIKGQFEKSLYFFNQALIYDPDNARIFMNIAGTYTQMKQSDKAMEYIQKAETLRKKVKN